MVAVISINGKAFIPSSAPRGLLGTLVLGILAATVATVTGAEPLKPAEVEFNPIFLRAGNAQQVDISRFAHGNPVLPGDYLVDLQVNDKWIGHISVRFVAQSGSDIAQPCLDRSVIERIGLDYEALPESARAELLRIKAGACADLPALVKGATVSFDLSELRLELSVPQASLLRTPRGYVSPELWDEGVPSATLDYNFNSFRASAPFLTTTSNYLGLIGGLNLDSWHLRQSSSLMQQSGEASTFQNIATYLMHDLPALKSDLIVGDAFTDGAIFNSIGFRGVSLATDDRMLPDSQRGYAPTVRGIARTNARVRITQNGNLLFETTVAPGAFEINDLYATGYGGDLLVTVYEADGSQESFTVPYTSLVQLLRPRVWRYSVAAGEVRDAQITNGDPFTQATVQYGFNNLITGYAGTIAARGYAAGLLGAAFNTPYGALATDLTQAKADISGALATNGRSLRVSYSKLVSDTQTNLSVAAYRYSSEGFWSFHDAEMARDQVAAGADPNTFNRQRSQLQLNINQNLGRRWGNAFLSGSSVNYWNYPGSTTQFQAGYNNSLAVTGINVNYSISLARQRDDFTGHTDKRLLVTFSFPLGRAPKAPRASMNLGLNKSNGETTRTSQEELSGTLGEDNELSYSASASQAPDNDSYEVSGQYRSPYTSLSASVSQGTSFSQHSWGLSGGVVVHPGGVTLANQLGDTIGIVEAKGAEGARISNGMGSRIDGRGYAIQPFLQPYRMNTVSIDPEGTPLDVEFKTTSQEIAPRADSVVMVRFATISGQAILVSAHLTDGSPVPFGASVFDAEGSEVGLVGQDGRIFLRGIAGAGRLLAKWGEAADQQCAFDYQLPPKGKDEGPLVHIDTSCGVELASLTQKNNRMKKTSLAPTTEGKWL